MTHLDPQTLSAMLDAALEGAARARAERHLAECASCRDRLAALAAQEAGLRPVLRHDPGAAYFETFAARVEDRIRAAGLSGAQSRLGSQGWLGWLSSPRRLASFGAIAAVVVGAAIVMLTSGPQRSPLENPELATRARQAAPSRTAPLPPSAARKESTPSGFRAAPMTALDESAPQEGAPEKKQPAGAPRAPSANEQPAPSVHEHELAQAAPQSAAPAPAGAAAPQRAMEVRRSASGEDVPVRRERAGFAEPPPAPVSGGDLKLAKPRAAQPLEQLSASTRVMAVNGVISLCGRVVDVQQRPIVGATVAMADTGLVTSADANGHFCLPVALGLHELTVMAIGYEPARHQIRVEGESVETQVTLRAVSVLDRSGSLTLDKRSDGASGTSLGPLQKFAGPPTAPRASTARALSARAESLRTALAFDRAAEAWAKAADKSRDEAGNEARYRLAETRFKAWQLAPTRMRATAARRAIDTFLALAPTGPHRESAVRWRRQLGK